MGGDGGQVETALGEQSAGLVGQRDDARAGMVQEVGERRCGWAEALESDAAAVQSGRGLVDWWWVAGPGGRQLSALTRLRKST